MTLGRELAKEHKAGFPFLDPEGENDDDLNRKVYRHAGGGQGEEGGGDPVKK